MNNLQTRFAALFASTLVTVAILAGVAALTDPGQPSPRLIALVNSDRA